MPTTGRWPRGNLKALAAVPRFMHYTDVGQRSRKGGCCSITCACGCTNRFHVVQSPDWLRHRWTRGHLGAGTARFYPAFHGMAMIIRAERDAAGGQIARAARVFRQVLADAERSADRLLLARALLATRRSTAGCRGCPAKPAVAGADRQGVALSREIGAVALVRARQVELGSRRSTCGPLDANDWELSTRNRHPPCPMLPWSEPRHNSRTQSAKYSRLLAGRHTPTASPVSVVEARPRNPSQSWCESLSRRAVWPAVSSSRLALPRGAPGSRR